MKVSVLMGDLGKPTVSGDWGYSLYIEHEDKTILLDAGSSRRFVEKADELGLDLEKVDFAVLSHAHFDHADGFEFFLAKNKTAPLYMREEAKNSFYENPLNQDSLNYIGPSVDIFLRFESRFEKINEVKTQISDGIWLLAHTTEGLDAIGRRQRLFKHIDGGDTAPDDFAHEHTLIFETADGLIVFNSCCHAGVLNIIKEVNEAFPDQKIKAIVGGFHLVGQKELSVRALAQELNKQIDGQIYTGHCTGEEQFGYLKAVLGDKLGELKAGLVFEL